MPYFQERPMRHIFLVEVSSWSENQNSLKEKLTEKRHLAMLEIYGIVLPWIRWAQWKGLKQELQQILLHGIIRYMDWIWLNTKGRGVKPCEMYSRGMKQHTIRTVIFFGCLGDAEVEKEWLVTLATINPSEVEYEDPFCVTLGTTICSGTGIIDPCLPWRTLCLVHGDWPSNWRSRPLEDVGWGQGLLLNSWHLSQSPTVSHFKIFRSNQHLVKWSDAEINYGKSHQILKIKAISS